MLAAVRGPARAGGVGLLAACDVVVAGASATFGFAEVRIGVVPAIISAVCRPRMLTHAAHRLMLTGEVFGAAVAAQTGLVDLAVADDEVDATVAAQVKALAAGAPTALAETKRLLRSGVAGCAVRRSAGAVGPVLRLGRGPGGHRRVPREAAGLLGSAGLSSAPP